MSGDPVYFVNSKKALGLAENTGTSLQETKPDFRGLWLGDNDFLQESFPNLDVLLQFCEVQNQVS